MNGGDPVVGGNQVTPGGTRPVTPGPQPAGDNAAAASNSSTDLTIPHDSPAPAAPTPMAPAAPSAPAADADFSSLHSEPVSSPTPPVVPTPSSPTSTASPANPLASTPVTPPQSPSPLGMSTPNITSGSPSAAPAGMGPGAPMSSTPMQNNFGQGPLTQGGFSQNPFSGGIYTPPVYSQSGDIILGGDTTPTKKSKAKAVLAVLAILIVVAGVVWAVVSSFGGLMGGSNSTTNDTKALLNTYSNYLLYGTDSSDVLSEDSSIWNTDNIDKQLSDTDTEAKNSYFDKLIELYEKFKDSYEKNTKLQEEIGEDSSEYVENVIENTMLALQTLKEYSSMPNTTEDEVKKMYLEQGGEEMLDKVANEYWELSQSSSASKSDYGSGKLGQADTIFKLYNEYNALGCINDRKISEECMAANDSLEPIAGYLDKLKEYSSIINSAEWHIRNNPIILSNMIYQALNYKEVENEAQ